VRWASEKESSPFSLHRNGWATPALPPFVNMWRAFSFGVGIIGAFVALIAYYYPYALAGDAKFALLAALVALAALPAIIFARMWRSVAQVVDLYKTVTLEKAVLEKFMEMQGMMRADYSPPPAAWSAGAAAGDGDKKDAALDAAIAKLPVPVNPLAAMVVPVVPVGLQQPLPAIEMTAFSSGAHKFQPTSGGEYDSVAAPPPLREDMTYNIFVGDEGFECRLVPS